MNILLISDDLSLVQSICRHLWRYGFSVDIVNSNEHRLGLALSRAYALVIVDEGLPGQREWEIIERIRNAGIRTPILLLTVLRQAVVGVVGRADGYLTRLFNGTELFSRIQALFQKKEGSHG